MKVSIARLTIRGMAPLSQSRQHDEPKLEGETHDDYDKRTCLSKLNLGKDGKVVIPQHGLHQCLIAAARYSGEQIPGQGKKTWTKKFETGLMIVSEVQTGIDPKDVKAKPFSVSAQGRRGIGGRVTRRFPMIEEWSATAEIYVLDPIITEAIFEKMTRTAGMFIGLGRFRPEVGGHNGRFKIETLEWEDNRQPLAA
jgi:hypothetical protein